MTTPAVRPPCFPFYTRSFRELYSRVLSFPILLPLLCFPNPRADEKTTRLRRSVVFLPAPTDTRRSKLSDSEMLNVYEPEEKGSKQRVLLPKKKRKSELLSVPFPESQSGHRLKSFQFIRFQSWGFDMTADFLLSFYFSFNMAYDQKLQRQI